MNTQHATDFINIGVNEYRYGAVPWKIGIGNISNTNQLQETVSISKRKIEGKPGLNFKSIYENTDVNDKVLNSWSPDFLIDYILNVHHQTAKENAITTYDMTQKVLYQHSDKHPELPKLAAEVFFFFNDFLFQLKMEEENLFPLIRQLINNSNNPETKGRFENTDVKSLIKGLQQEHLAATGELKHFRKISRTYMFHSNDNPSFRYLNMKMKKFENDLLQHIHIENNILFPKLVDFLKDVEIK